MLKVRHYDKQGAGSWSDAMLVSLLSTHLGDAMAVIAVQQPDGAFGSKEGMRLVVERNLGNIRVARSRIPLFDPESK